jgi:acyl-CoA reductase-like NAD-dependent aldehyde dehydrogenase
MTTTDGSRQRLLIRGNGSDARSGQSYSQAFPYTGEEVGTAAAAGREDARAAVEAASAAFADWSRSAPAMRREILGASWRWACGRPPASWWGSRPGTLP